MPKKDFAKKIAISTAIAGVAGYLAGILTAPKSGKETRQDIADTAHKGIGAAEKQLKQLHTELGVVITQTKDKSTELTSKGKAELDKAVSVAQDSKQKLREVLSAIHEGDAEDQELHRAMQDATKALKHLRKFLSK